MLLAAAAADIAADIALLTALGGWDSRNEICQCCGFGVISPFDRSSDECGSYRLSVVK